MNKEAQLISLLHEVLKVANHLVSHRKHSGSKNGNTGHSGIFAHQSKYNPYRAYTWDKGLQKKQSTSVRSHQFRKLKKLNKTTGLVEESPPVTVASYNW